MVGKTRAASKADKARFAAFREIGCLASHIEGLGYQRPTVHHVVEGRKRIADGNGNEHAMTVPLSEWHHLGIPPQGCWNKPERARTRFGPSLFHHHREFVRRYGTERQLIHVADAAVRIVEDAGRRGEWIEPNQMGDLVRALHREIVLKSPPKTG